MIVHVGQFHEPAMPAADNHEDIQVVVAIKTPRDIYSDGE